MAARAFFTAKLPSSATSAAELDTDRTTSDPEKEVQLERADSRPEPASNEALEHVCGKEDALSTKLDGERAEDAFRIDWDSPGPDPKNPQAWSFSRKWTTIALITAITLIPYVLRRFNFVYSR